MMEPAPRLEAQNIFTRFEEVRLFSQIRYQGFWGIDGLIESIIQDPSKHLREQVQGEPQVKAYEGLPLGTEYLVPDVVTLRNNGYEKKVLGLRAMGYDSNEVLSSLESWAVLNNLGNYVPVELGELDWNDDLAENMDYIVRR